MPLLGTLKVWIWFEYEKLCFPFISLSFCRLLIGSAVTIVLHASVHSHSNNFICSYYIKANFIKFDQVVIFQGQVVKSKPRAIILGVPWSKMIICCDYCHLQSHLTLKMASTQVVKTSVANKSPSQESSHPDDHFQSG